MILIHIRYYLMDLYLNLMLLSVMYFRCIWICMAKQTFVTAYILHHTLIPHLYRLCFYVCIIAKVGFLRPPFVIDEYVLCDSCITLFCSWFCCLLVYKTTWQQGMKLVWKSDKI